MGCCMLEHKQNIRSLASPIRVTAAARRGIVRPCVRRSVAMQDPRALMNPKNLESYRAWGQEGARRSGFMMILAIVTGLTPVLTMSALFLRPAGGYGHDAVVLIGAAGALYLAAMLGLTLFAALRLRAWKRAHPWEPPPRAPWK